ncbi:MAG: 4-oxalomesaconate tautomerase [Ardenticatenaceae bacterium]|nr:4-oxalomesaconate tautomerase [Ardenticatenaceae bacterium]
MQRAIPYMQLRGGSSKGLYFKASDLPADEVLRNRVVIAAMEGVGMGDPRQIDGLGGADSLTSKVAIVSLSLREDADLDYLFLQVVIGGGYISTVQNCGNILAGVLPFAIESGLWEAQDGETTATIHMVNSGGLCEVTVQTPNRRVMYAGEATVDGVPGTAAPIICNYLDVAGSATGSLLPTGNVVDVIEGVTVTAVDNGMPVVVLRATDLDITGYESKAELDANDVLKARLEAIRLAIGPAMNLGDVTHKTVPKMCLISPPNNGGYVNTRTFIPHVCHAAIGVLGAVSVATACLLPGSVAAGIVQLPGNGRTLLSIEHPTGEFSVDLDMAVHGDTFEIRKSGAMRTARLMSRGELFIPAGIW